MPGCNFFCWPAAQVRYGASVFSGCDLNGEPGDELVVGAGPDPAVPSLIKVYYYGEIGTTPWMALQAFPASWHYGARVAAGQF